jgi:hypothetical protein
MSTEGPTFEEDARRATEITNRLIDAANSAGLSSRELMIGCATLMLQTTMQALGDPIMLPEDQPMLLAMAQGLASISRARELS